MLRKTSLIACLLMPFIAAPPAAATEKMIYGYLERVLVSHALFTMNAKLDTGADTSSLDAQIIKRFRRGGKRWVRFTIEDPDTGQRMEVEKELVRDVRIKSHFGRYQKRPVVLVPICLGEHYRDVEVSLVDRKNFNYPVLLGRLALAGRAIVDPAEEYLHEPACDTVIGEEVERQASNE